MALQNFTPQKKKLGDMLVETGFITQDQLDKALEVQRVKGGKLGDILSGLNYCGSEVLLAFLGNRCGVSYISLSEFGRILPEIIALIPGAMARQQTLIPLERVENVLTVAMSDPLNVSVTDDLKILTGCEIKVVIAAEKEIQTAVDQCYGKGPSGVEISNSPADPILEALLENALKSKATHVHIELLENTVRVRYRVGGRLEIQPDLPTQSRAFLVKRVRSLGPMNGVEHVPQEGRLRVRVDGCDRDVQVSSLPTPTGEKIVFHLPGAAPFAPDLARLGFELRALETYLKVLEAPQGLVLVAGPPRSGKTTTLYASLTSLNRPERSIVTLEDPVERTLDGITQVQARPDMGFSASSRIRSLLRQDPDVLLVGDIRDRETAEACLDAALSRCRVFSSLRATENAPVAIGRLREMGVAPALLASALTAVVFQRLIRTLCDACKEPCTYTLGQLLAAGVNISEVSGGRKTDSFTLFKGGGCGRCFGTGYQGSMGVFEVLPINDGVRRLIAEKASLDQIRRQTSDTVPLRHAVMEKMMSGVTGLDEVLKTVGNPC